MTYKINNIIRDQKHQQLQVQKLVKTPSVEILGVSLEKGAIFPKHTSPTEAQLIVLEGKINFHIEDKNYVLGKHQLFSFPKEIVHWVTAEENAKFLIVR